MPPEPAPASRRGGVPVRVRPAAAVQLGLMAALIAGLASATGTRPGLALATGGTAAAVVLGSLLAHEAAHAATARALGVPVLGVQVQGLLHAAVRRTATRDPRTEVAVSLAGPLASALLLVAGMVAVAAELPLVAAAAARTAVGVNALALLATLPLHPGSDGALAYRAWRAHRAGA